MNKWQEHLQSQNPLALQPDNHLCALPGLGLLYVGGDDAGDFLQNQLSNDINALTSDSCQFSSASISKGRMYGIFRILKIDGGFILLMPREILPEVQKRLQKYVLMSKVVMGDISDSFARFSASMQDDTQLATDIKPAEVNAVTQSDSLICLRLHAPAGAHRFLFLSNNEDESVALWDQLAQTLSVNDESAWLHDEIVSGVPAIYTNTIEAFVPQMANLDALDGINFKKGCYPGQEIVARTRYLGKLKRRMFLAEVASEQCPAPGDELSADPAKADGGGKVVHAVSTSEGRCVMLFVGLIEKAEANALHLVAQPTQAITLMGLPYSIE